jgi:uncharacterized membrane protein YeaQ/YmgE (transglycosylase-associated protein family)
MPLLSQVGEVPTQWNYTGFYMIVGGIIGAAILIFLARLIGRQKVL